ncbi:FecR domain-containing protein [Asticcacaulis sp. YBE204]|uniref:FecR family protein n=1 Tax=Asticcacaulis sp. YBE204 TaxID=1282363 RepID=UPI0003C3C3B8|nr:FecR domain-containing protein [Asticcacaulis sp. YBE204]ESQ78274.1 hypothetical protein AEYBE204_13970 [Asticcacaulis sp. YBE204]
MTQKQTAHQIEDIAVAWATRLDNGPLPDEEARALDLWLDSDIRCVGALARAEAYIEASKKAVALDAAIIDDLAARHKAKAGLSRRDVYKYGAAAAGLSALGIASYATMAAAGTYETRKGEMKVVTLSDGSSISLNTDTKVRVAFSAKRRLVHLFGGEAMFTVAKDVGRPFVVSAKSAFVTAMATSFTVGDLPDRPLTVVVSEGVLQIDRADGKGQPVKLDANTRVRFEPTAAMPVLKIEKISTVQVDDDMAWRSGRISFKGETLDEATRAFARYSDIELIIDDPGLRGEKIAGVFQNNDPVGFAETVALSFDLRIDIQENRIYLSRKAA